MINAGLLPLNCTYQLSRLYGTWSALVARVMSHLACKTCTSVPTLHLTSVEWPAFVFKALLACFGWIFLFLKEHCCIELYMRNWSQLAGKYVVNGINTTFRNVPNRLIMKTFGEGITFGIETTKKSYFSGLVDTNRSCTIQTQFTNSQYKLCV